MLSIDAWQHVAVSANTNAASNQVRIYVDGADVTNVNTFPGLEPDGGGGCHAECQPR